MDVISTNYNQSYTNYEVIPPGEDEEMGQNSVHVILLDYLIAVLSYLFANTTTGIYRELYLFGDPENPGQPKSPDIMVIPNWPNLPSVYRASYRIGQDGTPPPVVFEISSPGNWQQDVEPNEKPAVYARMGVREYFAYDPYPERAWTGEWHERGRLIGWKLAATGNSYDYIERDAQGRMWSETLQSFLEENGPFLRLYNQNGKRRLTKTENLAEKLQQLGIDPEKLDEQ